ncbi:calcineurin-like phosphoesterase family protein [Wenyingzhuangia sp. 2_MG-2023]|uniref:calcineurin-like phosphoesterase family protein n=1 Tax=Wenyingzhuangia sp. 2_MG-2023 TaxID=3062639 RepID=UPI0026E32FD7|nr:calcineurin-like phosphoesterase family protein [Wenyingzhuangia sp. 2_MG-2023]MDO6738703.1 calcineurin-like phosphoesterase family protein [Wenyingzhuangia sp. 2_MG-2023]
MKQTRRKFLKIGGLTTVASFSGVGLTFASCQNNASELEVNDFNITGVSIPSSVDVVAGESFELTGKGFEVGDQILLKSSSNSEISHICNVINVTDRNATFVIPQEFSTGTYQITVQRNTESLLLGSLLLNVIANVNIPDVEGMTVKGVVYADGQGISGVSVSDGHEVTVTDVNGVYYLPSLKKTGFVFISIPGNYEVPTVGNAPQFFKRLSSNATTVEQKDFSLIKVNNQKHVVIPMADWHLANRNNDVDQYTSKIVPDVNDTIAKYSADGTKVYILTLGDMTWDLYWYTNNFGLNEYLPYMNMLDCPVFNLIGNHDYDPYYANDWEAENKYREVLGPTYYSFNIGDIHYVVLDDVEYINSGGSIGTVGSRNYSYNINGDQLKWLQQDLEAVADKSTPIVLAMHTPLYKRPTLDASGNQINDISLYNGDALIDLLKPFSKVHVLSGHLHENYRVEQESNLIEHNTGAVCATWWWTGKNGYADNHICKDGSPGGYSIWNVNNRNMEWKYKGIGHDENYQFRTYDLNSVHITAADFAPQSTDADLAIYADSYSQKNLNNEVLINVWGYEKDWQIEVSENGNQLAVTRITAKDPLHIISYDALRLNNGATPTSAFATNETSHLFKVIASAPNTTLEIKVIDRFGNVYTESMVRPKAFSLSTK